jgi:membrane protein DedA with SNARE-associated domain
MGYPELIYSYMEGHLYVAYALMLFGVIIEGELMLIILGILAHTKVVPAPIALSIAASGAAIKTFLGYEIGRLIKKYIPQNKIFDFIEKRVHLTFPHFSEKPFWSLFFSKFVYGLNHFTIIFAGYINSNRKTYLTAELISSVAWIVIMFSIGYFFSYTAFGLSTDLKKVGLILLLGIIAFLLISRFVNLIIEFIESEEDYGK